MKIAQSKTKNIHHINFCLRRIIREKDRRKYNGKSGGCAQYTIAAIFEILGAEDEGVFKEATNIAHGV